MKSYKDLEVYKKSYRLSLEIHRLSMKFPRHEMYEIGSQLRRSAVSIPLNIAEGYGRKVHRKDFRNFLIIALGSCDEVNVLLDMVKDLGYQVEGYESIKEEYDHLGRQLNTFIQRISE